MGFWLYRELPGLDGRLRFFFYWSYLLQLYFVMRDGFVRMGARYDNTDLLWTSWYVGVAQLARALYLLPAKLDTTQWQMGCTATTVLWLAAGAGLCRRLSIPLATLSFWWMVSVQYVPLRLHHHYHLGLYASACLLLADHGDDGGWSLDGWLQRRFGLVHHKRSEDSLEIQQKKGHQRKQWWWRMCTWLVEHSTPSHSLYRSGLWRQLLCAVVALSYFASGWCKLSVGGIGWLEGWEIRRSMEGEWKVRFRVFEGNSLL